MTTQTRTSSVFALAAVALVLTTTSANAAIIVDPSKDVNNVAVGTLVAIDVPFAPNGFPTVGGPNWPENADDGFATVNDDFGLTDGASNWEPDGTPINEALGYFTFGNGPIPSVTWSFNLADSGVDIPDGAVINGVYATWNTRNSDGITYQYTEGAASDSIVRQNGGAAPAADLVLSWDDAINVTRNGNFERIFNGPITVVGGDGFQLLGTDNIQNAAHIDAVVLDVTLPSASVIPEPSTFALTALGLLSLGMIGWRRRNR